MNFFVSRLARAYAFASRYWAGALSSLVGVALVGVIALAELRLRAGSFSDFSDYWEHAAVLRALMDAPFHPSNPHLAVAIPSPRFGPLAVLLALVVRALGLDAPAGMSIAAVANTLCFVLGIWLFFRSYFRDPRAGLYGLVVMLCSWWEAWTFTSIYQPKVLLSVACYPWLTAFGVTLLGLTLALRVLRAKQPHWLAYAALALWAAIVFLTHQITAMMALGALFLLALTEPQVSLSRRAWVAASAIAGCALASFWPYFSVWHLLAGGHSDPGWVGRSVEAAAQGKVVVQRHRFYRVQELLPALGLALVGVVALPYFFLRFRRLFVGLGVLAMLVPFAINAYVPLPLGHRFLLLAVFFLQVAVVWLLLVLTPGSPEFWRVLNRRWLRVTSLAIVWGVLLTFGYHNVQRTRKEWAYFASFARRGESIYMRYSRRVAQLAGPRAVILGDPRILWPVPTFGPKAVAELHENPFVPDEEQRFEASDAFFNPRVPDTTRLKLIQQYGVTHVIVKREPRGAARAFLVANAQRMPLPGGYTLFALTHPLTGESAH